MKENSIEKKKEVSRIHFLVHPGFMAKEEGDRKINPTYAELLAKYPEKAKTLKEDEIMVVFAPAANRYFVGHVKNDSELFVECIKQIKSILGDRAVILSSQGETVKDYSEGIWDKIEKIVKARGFALSKNLTAEAYGEYLTFCVSQVASHMHKISGMSEENPVILRAELSEFSIPEQRDRLPRKLQPNTEVDYTGTQ